jgi:uncharacterized SAM-binding protein YcdF (DUF218 family)
MSFVLSKIFWLVADPTSLLLAFMVASLILLATSWRRAGMRLAIASISILIAVAVLPIGKFMLGSLENRFPAPASLPDRIDGIVLLGGSTNAKRTESRDQPSLSGSAGRIVAFVELARRYPEARLVMAGGSGSLRPGRLTGADVTRMVLRQIGFDTERVLFESTSRNTYENAVNARALATPRRGETWLLVTSASHMPRAVGVFRKAGWTVVAYPVDYQTPPTVGFYPRWGIGGLGSFRAASHEWIGLLAYYLLDRTDALFPAPL